jgi:hypothetical protein
MTSQPQETNMTIATPKAGPAPSSFRKPAGPTEALGDTAKAADEGPAKCSVCESEVEEKWRYCSLCGWPVDIDEIVRLEDDDLESYLFNGYAKKGFTLFGDRIKFELRTLQAKDNNDIAKKMSEYADGKKVLNADFQAEQRMQVMVKALVSWMGGELDDEKARTTLEAMSEGVLTLIQDRYNAMCRGVELELSKERRIKKS